VSTPMIASCIFSSSVLLPSLQGMGCTVVLVVGVVGVVAIVSASRATGEGGQPARK